MSIKERTANNSNQNILTRDITLGGMPIVALIFDIALPAISTASAGIIVQYKSDSSFLLAASMPIILFLVNIFDIYFAIIRNKKKHPSRSALRNAIDPICLLIIFTISGAIIGTAINAATHNGRICTSGDTVCKAKPETFLALVASSIAYAQTYLVGAYIGTAIAYYKIDNDTETKKKQ